MVKNTDNHFNRPYPNPIFGPFFKTRHKPGAFAMEEFLLRA